MYNAILYQNITLRKIGNSVSISELIQFLKQNNCAMCFPYISIMELGNGHLIKKMFNESFCKYLYI